MRFLIRTHLLYETTQPCDLLLQIEALSDDAQQINNEKITFDSATTPLNRQDRDGPGTYRWVQAGSRFECQYQAEIDVTRSDVDLDRLSQTARIELPGDVITYLLPSRYCHSELFLDFVSTQFGDLSGGPLISAMREWISRNFTYDSDASHAGTTASDSFNSLAGVCRDYAHVMISLARAGGIPARFVSVYGPDVAPQDFHAVAEVYLEGKWHLVDPTGMAEANDIIRICAGRDAADASFMTSYGWMNLHAQSVDVQRIAP